MRYGWIAGLIAVIALAMGLAGGYRLWRRSGAPPASLTGPNILPNSDFTLDADGDKLPDGWLTAGVGGVELSDFTFNKQGRSVQISGINNYLRSPLIDVRPGEQYRVAFRALAEDPEKPSPTRVRVRFRWYDAEGMEFSNLPGGPWQDVPHLEWATVSATTQAPQDAVQMAMSIHLASDAPVLINELQLGQVGVRISAWPDGKQAALALSFDYETAMGGLVHSRSDDPNSSTNMLDRAQRMRAGVDEILQLFAPAGIRGTWYVNGYNFLTGNRERRQFMGNPTYTWANTGTGWSTDTWANTPWFSPDPYSDERAAPEWYFGSQIESLRAAGQDIQSHTFAHFAGGLVTPDDWRADFTAWNDAAAARQVPKATSLAFPWSYSAGMRWDSWEVLAANGIRSVTRTNWTQPRFNIADRTSYALRRLPGHESITVIADEYLTSESVESVLSKLEAARLNGGAIDVWAHTEEVTSAEQKAAWARVIAQREPFWVAPIPEIVAWKDSIRNVEIRLRAEAPEYVFDVSNGNRDAVRGVTLVLPYTPGRVVVDGREADAADGRLRLDLPGRSTVEVSLWPA